MLDLRDQLQASLGATYILGRELGGAGMSRVFVATDTRLEREVVVKVLSPELAAGLSAERFTREIKVAAHLQEPHIVPVLADGVTSGGLPYYLMPFVRGASLRDRLISGRISISETVGILTDVAKALAFAHSRGVMHRDIKPENVLLHEGTAVVTDFGIAKAIAASTTQSAAGTLTAAGTSLGTPAYMAPEQATGDAVDHRADLYAWGVMAYEMISGHHPFAGKATAQQLIAAHIVEIPAPITTETTVAPRALCALVMRCMAKNPADRPQHASDILTELATVSTPVAGMQTGILSSRRNRAGIVTALVLAAAASVFAIIRLRPHDAATLDPKRVVVATFENRTGDPSLDSYGVMAADWISRGLSGTGLVDVAGTATELAARGGKREDVAGKSALQSLATSAAAGLVISGGFYKQGDSVLFTADLTDANAGKLIQSVGPVTASIARPLDAIERLRQRVTASLATLLDPGLAGIAGVTHQPPSPEAYREFLAGEELFYTDDQAALPHFNRAAALDPSYVYPLMRVLSILSNQGHSRQADSVAELLLAKKDALTDIERAYVDFSRAIVRGDPETLYRAALEMGRAAPASPFASYGLGIASVGSGRPAKADSVFRNLDPAGGAMRGRIYYFTNYSIALHTLGEYDRQLELVHRGEKQYPHRVMLLVDEGMALAGLGRIDELYARVGEATTLPPDQHRAQTTVIRVAIHELRFHGHPNEARALATKWTPWLTALRTTSAEELRELALALMAAEQWSRARTLADSLLLLSPNDAAGLGIAGLTMAIEGDRAGASRIMSGFTANHDQAGRGQRLLLAASISLALGDTARSMELFKQSAPPGTLDGEFGHGLWLFDRLHDYAPMKEYLKPRG